MNDDHPLNVLIAGAGVAGLEAALGLHQLAGDRVSTTLLAPSPEFVYRPLLVREPFAYATAYRYPLDRIAEDAAAELRPGALRSLDPDRRVIQTDSGETVPYDVLLLALGARQRPHFDNALTLDDRQMDEQLHGIIQDIEAGYIHSLALLVPPQMAWPLPIYELALMTARRAFDMDIELAITIVTPEDAPLAIFGPQVSEAVEQLLVEHGVDPVTAAHAETPASGAVSIHPGPRSLHVDRVIALPELVGPDVSGVPRSGPAGFIPVDGHGRVRGLERVYAAGDAVDFMVKHGGIAAQQADVAAEAIAARAGAPIEPSEFLPVLHGVLIGGRTPLYMRAQITGGHGTSSEASETPLWSPAAKIAARYLSSCLESQDRALAS